MADGLAGRRAWLASWQFPVPGWRTCWTTRSRRWPGCEPDLILISVGANDTIHLTGRGAFRHTYEKVVRALPTGVPVVLLGVPDMGAIPRFAQPLRAVSGWRGRQSDAEVRRVAAGTGAVYADIAGPTGPPFRRHPDRYFAADDFHPSDAGYGLWADAVLKVLRNFSLP